MQVCDGVWSQADLVKIQFTEGGWIRLSFLKPVAGKAWLAKAALCPVYRGWGWMILA